MCVKRDILQLKYKLLISIWWTKLLNKTQYSNFLYIMVDQYTETDLQRWFDRLTNQDSSSIHYKEKQNS